MFEIPAWAIGVGVIIIAASIAGALKRLISGESGGSRLRHQGLSLPELMGGRGRGRMTSDLESRLGDVDALRSRLGELEDMQRRLAELEERVDFTERLLAKQRDAERLAPPPQS